MNAPLILGKTALVHSVPDPQIAGRTVHNITGTTAEQVQDAIDTLTRSVDVAFGGARGIAKFTHPIRQPEGWQSIGYVRLVQGAA